MTVINLAWIFSCGWLRSTQPSVDFLRQSSSFGWMTQLISVDSFPLPLAELYRRILHENNLFSYRLFKNNISL